MVLTEHFLIATSITHALNNGKYQGPFILLDSSNFTDRFVIYSISRIKFKKQAIWI